MSKTEGRWKKIGGDFGESQAKLQESLKITKMEPCYKNDEFSKRNLESLILPFSVSMLN